MCALRSMRSLPGSPFLQIKNRASAAILNGKRATSRIPNWWMQDFVGIEIGGTKLQLVLGDETGKISERRRFSVDPAKGAAGIRRQIEQGVSELIGRHKPEAIGVGFGGPGCLKNRGICPSHQIEGWLEFGFWEWPRPISRAKDAVG